LNQYDFAVDRRTDNYSQQRGREQILHDMHNPRLDKIRPISKHNKRIDEYLEAAKEIE